MFDAVAAILNPGSSITWADMTSFFEKLKNKLTGRCKYDFGISFMLIYSVRYSIVVREDISENILIICHLACYVITTYCLL